MPAPLPIATAADYVRLDLTVGTPIVVPGAGVAFTLLSAASSIEPDGKGSYTHAERYEIRIAQGATSEDLHADDHQSVERYGWKFDVRGSDGWYRVCAAKVGAAVPNGFCRS